jgi:hypothetical protein
MLEDRKTQALTVQQRDARLAMGCCPMCASQGHITARLRKRPGKAYENPETGRVTVGGWFYECPEGGWEHYYLSPGDGRNAPRETAGLALPAEPTLTPPVVIRRAALPRRGGAK